VCRAVRDHVVSLGVVVDWATQIACGMNYLHADSPVSVVHCDLKTANTLLAEVCVWVCVSVCVGVFQAVDPNTYFNCFVFVTGI
jgi:hypothetical protein